MKTSEPISADALYPTLKSLLQAAKKAGAESADVIATHGRSLGISVRENALEDIESSAGRDIGLRVMIGQRQACVSSSDLSSDSLTALAERAVAMAKLAPEDPWCGLADQDRLADIENTPDLDVYDDTEMNPEALKNRAHELEAATLSIQGVGQAEGANASWSTSAMLLRLHMGFYMGGGPVVMVSLSRPLPKETGRWNAIMIMRARDIFRNYLTLPRLGTRQGNGLSHV